LTDKLADEWVAEESEQLVDDWLNEVRKVQEDTDDLVKKSNELVKLDVADDGLNSLDDACQEDLDVEFHLLIELGQSLDDSDMGSWSWQVESLLFGQWEDGGDQGSDGVDGRLDQSWEELLEKWLQQLGDVKTSFAEETQNGASDQVDSVVNDVVNQWINDVVNDESPGVSFAEETQDSASDQIDGVVDDVVNQWINNVVDDESPSVSFSEDTQNGVGEHVGSVVDDSGDEWLDDVVDEEIDEISLDGNSTDQEDQ
jgi:hypothetical protein